MMNQTKKNNGWILCSSKSFPGKFYYFNVVNGEAAWSLNDVDNPTLKRDCRMQKVDKSYSYPEPSSPPMDDTPNVSFLNNSHFKKPNYNTIPKRVINNNTQVQTFGQAIFPKYVEPYMPNIIWTPIQLPQQMYISSTPEMGMKMPYERMGQPRDSDRSLFVQTCDLSLSKRFEMYTKHSTVNKKVETRQVFNKFYETSTPIKSGYDGNIMDNNKIFGSKENIFQKPKEIKSFMREPVLKRVRTQSDSENGSQVFCNISKANSAESLINFENSDLMKSSMTEGSKVENKDENSKVNVSDKLGDLDSNDLRFLLVAKRRKSVDLGDFYKTSDGKKIKTTKEEAPKITPKKRVTFDLGDQVSSDGVDDQTEENFENTAEDVSPNNQDEEDRLLYIAADVDTLLDEYEFIEEYTQSVDNRRLLIPHKLQAGIEAVCLGDCRGRQRVIAARQITRKLVNPPSHYVLLPETEDSPSSVQCLLVDNHADNYILNACLQVLNVGDMVMLITNNTDLYNDAKTLNIDCFKPQELKDGAGNAKPEVSFELKKLKTKLGNEKQSNLFLQPTSEFEPYLVKNKEDISYKKQLDKNEENIPKKHTFKDANTSPIGSELLDERTDRLVDITRKKLPSMPLIDKSTNEIGLDMQNLFIKDKPKKNEEKQNARFENGTFENRKVCKQNVSKPESIEKNSLDGILSVYSVKNKDMEENIKIRLDEFICCFTQLLENTLIDVLMKHSPITDKLSPPWVLYESLKAIQELYGSHTKVNMVIEKMMGMLMNYSSKIGKLKLSIKPNELLKIIGCSIILIETLKSIEPSISLQESSNALTTLLQDMSQPAPDIPLFTTPIVSRGEYDTTKDERRNYIKKPSEIIEYLKKHFSDWKDYEIKPDFDKETTKVLRTCGRDLNLLKIDNNRSISLNTRTNTIMKAVQDNAIHKSQLATNIDGITRINDEKLTKTNCDYGNTKMKPIVFRKFDSSFIFNIGNEKNKPTSTRNGINIIENVDMFDDNEAKAKGCDMPKTIEKEKIPITKSNDIFTKNINSEPKIVRIFDNLLKNNDKVTTTNDDDLNVPKHGNTFNHDKETTGPKVIRTFDNLFPPKVKDKSLVTLNIDDLNVPKHGNTFNQDKETAGPKVIRNIKPIGEFEEKLTENSKMLNLDALDYSEIEPSVSETIKDDSSVEDSVSFVYAIRNQNRKPITIDNDKNIAEVNDNALNNCRNTNTNDDSAFHNDVIGINKNNDINDTVDDSNDKLVINDDTNDSGFENENVQPYALVKMFLAELSDAVKALYEFIIKSINEYREDDNQEEKKRALHEKANRTHLAIAEIMDKLKIIIQRESNEGTTVKAVLMKAGVQASSDKRMTRYRQVVTKCLEQVQILENALKTVLVLTNDLNSISSDSEHSDMRYINIFE